MGYKSGIEKAMDASADTSELWINGVETFWSELRDKDASVSEALRRAIVFACGARDTDRIEKAQQAFWFTVRGVPRP